MKLDELERLWERKTPTDLTLAAVTAPSSAAAEKVEGIAKTVQEMALGAEAASRQRAIFENRCVRRASLWLHDKCFIGTATGSSLDHLMLIIWSYQSLVKVVPVVSATNDVDPTALDPSRR